MKKLFLLFAMMLTVCSTAMAQTQVLDEGSPVGTIGTLAGREAMVVDLGGAIGKVAIATKNVGAVGEVVSDYGTHFTPADANDADKNGLTDGWYVPSKKELDALTSHLTQYNAYHCVKWEVTETATLYLPCRFVSGGYKGDYVSSKRTNWGDYWTCYIYGFSFDNSGNFSYGADNRNESEYTDCAIRPFHKLPTVEELRTIGYTSSDGNVVTPNYEDHFGEANIVSNVYQDGKGVITFDRNLTCIGDYAFMDCDNLTSIEIPNNVESIGSQAFYGVALTSITLPSSLKEIGPNCFGNCKKLLYARFLGATPPTYTTIYPFANSEISGTALLVPEGTVESYTAAGYTNVFSQTNIKSEILAHIEKALNTDVPLSNADKASLAAIKEAVNSTTDIETMLNEYNEFKNLFKTGSQEAVHSLFWFELSIYSSPLRSQYIDRIGKAQSVEEIEAIVKEVQDYIIALKAKREEAKATVNSLFWLELSIYSSPLQSQYIARIEKAQSVEEIEAIVKEVQDYVAKYKDVKAKREEAKNTILLYISSDEYYQKYHDKIIGAETIEEIEAIVNDFLNEFRRNNPCLEIGNKIYTLTRGNSVGPSLYQYIYFDELTPDIEWPDATEYHLPSDALLVLFERVKVNYSRTLPEGVWQCWHEPFRTIVDNSQFDAAEVAGILFNDEGEEFVAFRKLKDGADMEGNTVYVIRAKEGHSELQIIFSEMWLKNNGNYQPLSIQSAYDNYTFYGTDTPKEHGNWYTLDKNGTFRQMASGSLKPQRFYMTITPRDGYDRYYPNSESSASTRAMINYVVLGDDEDGTTGITSCENESADKNIYDLKGQKVTNIRKGQIYIMNGKKYIGK